jgi:RNA-directed DNA polymerase
MNRLNKDGKPLAESEEGRPLIKENTHQSSTHSTQSEARVSQGLAGVRKAAKERKGMQFTALLHHVTVALLREGFYALKRKAAPGVDGVTWEEYESGLEGRLVDLHRRVHRGAYRAQPSRRVYIPKPDGRQRPLGVAALEDKIVQHAVVTILNQIYEEDFRGFSYGFRPGRSQHQALDALYIAITRKKVNYVLDADIRGFFDNLDRGWLLKFLQHRVADPRMLRLIQKWLEAGVMEEGEWKNTETGTPQGSVISPLLAISTCITYSTYGWTLGVRSVRTAMSWSSDTRMTTYSGSSAWLRQTASWWSFGNGWRSSGWSYTQTKRAGSSSGGVPSATGRTEEKGSPKRSTFWDSRISAGKLGTGISR